MSELTLEPVSVRNPSAVIAGILLFFLLVTAVPQFVCMPLTNDTALYDLQAKTALNGGVLYRDIFEPNLPGVVWIHMVTRSITGWSSGAMRIVDLVALTGIVLLLTRWLAQTGRGSGYQLWTAIVVCLCYFSMTEWCHCQRDTWMLIPTLTALQLRLRRMRLQQDAPWTSQQIFRSSFVEGICWAIAFWIKPHIIIPATTVWLLSSLIQKQGSRWIIDGLGVLCGGLLIGGVGSLWLIQNGAWPYLWDTLLNWNPRYMEERLKHWTLPRFVSMAWRYQVWLPLHLLAVPLAVQTMGQTITQQRHQTTEDSLQRNVSGVLAAFYLAWFAQSFLLQHLFDYVHTPGVLLAVTFLMIRYSASERAPGWKPMGVLFLLLAMIASPRFRQSSIPVWQACVTEGSTPAVKNELAGIPHPDWEDLENVATWLEQQSTGDQEIAAFNNNLVYLYQRLDQLPPTRHVYMEQLAILFPELRRETATQIEHSSVRFVVTDLVGSGVPADIAVVRGDFPPLELPQQIPAGAQRIFPWKYPIVYRSGSILVHQIPRPEPNALSLSRSHHDGKPTQSVPSSPSTN